MLDALSYGSPACYDDCSACAAAGAAGTGVELVIAAPAQATPTATITADTTTHRDFIACLLSMGMSDKTSRTFAARLCQPLVSSQRQRLHRFRGRRRDRLVY